MKNNCLETCGVRGVIVQWLGPELRLNYAIIKCKILDHCGICVRMITFF